ncbi:MAG: hypothetical protein HQK49_22655 [Oligoflexia bacterium]|nr:hypothetical protein [Oligoflexia bacterium]
MSEILRQGTFDSFVLIEMEVKKEIRYSKINNKKTRNKKIIDLIHSFGLINFIDSKIFIGKTYGLSIWDKTRIGLSLDPLVLFRKRKFIFEQHTPDINLIKFDCYENNFEKIVCDLLPQHIPDDFYSICKYIGKKINIFFAQNPLFHIKTHSKIAAISANGSKIIRSQHGGAYGQSASHQCSKNEYDTCHFFTNWGWSNHLGYPRDKFVNLPSPLISKLAIRYKRSTSIKNNLLLYVSSSDRKYLYTYNSWLLPEQQLNWMKQKVSFIKSLDHHLINKFTYRPYIHDLGSNDDEFMQNELGFNLKLLTGGNIYRIMNKYKLMIFDHRSTGYLFRLALNMPMIIHYDRNYFLMFEEAEKDMDELRQVNIFFHDPKKAAAHVNSIYENIDLWWSNPQVQKALQKHVKKYALNSTTWFKEWKNFIHKINSESVKQ